MSNTFNLKYKKEYYSYVNDEGTASISIIKSGFVGLYNVIVEDGEMDSVNLFPTLNLEQIKNKFGIYIDLK